MQNAPSPLRRFALSIPVSLILFLVACGVTESTPVSDDRGTGNQPVEVAEVPSAGSAELPAEFPPDFPLPPDLTITEANFTPADAMTQANFLVRGTSASSVEELAAFYREELPQAGYELLQAQPPAPGASQALVYFKGGNYRDASVQVSDEAGTTNILISLPLRD